MKIKTLLVAAVSVVLVACGGGEKPEVVVKNFFDASKAAMKSGNFDALKTLSTEDFSKVWEFMPKMIEMSKEMMGEEAFNAQMEKEMTGEITDIKCTEEGEKATCTCKVGEKEQTLELAKVDGAWKVAGDGQMDPSQIEEQVKQMEGMMEMMKQMKEASDSTQMIFDSLGNEISSEVETMVDEVEHDHADEKAHH